MSASGKRLYLLTVCLIMSSLGTAVPPLAFATEPAGGDRDVMSIALDANAPSDTGQQTDEDDGESSSMFQNPKPASADAQNFDANGTINAISFITKSLKYDLQGVWSMHVRDGNAVQFEATMAAIPSSQELGKPHTHQLLNYQPSEIGLRDSDNNFFTNGTIDVGTNNSVTWTGVPVVISITNGSSILIALDDEQAGHHFAGQPIVGTVESVIDCSQVPGAAMSIESVCQPEETGAETEGEGGENNSGTEDAGGSINNGSITVVADSDTYGPNEIPQISGNVNGDAVSGTVAQVDVSDSSDTVVYNTVAGVAADGSFSTGLKNFDPGQYTVVVTYHGSTGTASFEVIET
ncbi:MAG TPA: hypothetical protein VHA09_01885 [Nitrososphaera sp.]|nr:hypothetical protein [Nitrososphaera sp.]